MTEARSPEGVPVRDLTAFAIDILGVKSRLSLSRSPIKSDEEHVRAKLADFFAVVLSVPGVTSLTRFTVPGHPNCVLRLSEGVFEEIYTIPYLTQGMWKGPVAQGVAGFSMITPVAPSATTQPSPFGSLGSHTSTGKRKLVDDDHAAVSMAQKELEERLIQLSPFVTPSMYKYIAMACPVGEATSNSLVPGAVLSSHVRALLRRRDIDAWALNAHSEELNKMHRQGLLAIRLGHQYRTTLTQVVAMVTGYVNTICNKRGSLGTAKKFIKGIAAVKKALGHDNERKALPTFRLQFLSWCIQLHEAGQLRERLAATHSNLTADAAVLTFIQTLANDLKQERCCRTATKFRQVVKSGLRDLLTDDKLEKYVKTLLQEFASDLLEANGGHQESAEPTEWPEACGTLGSLTDESPFMIPQSGSRGRGNNVTHKAILSTADSTNLEQLFHATGAVFQEGFERFMTAHPYAVFRVPLPELPEEDTPEETRQKIHIHGPKKGFLPVVGVLMLQAVAKFAGVVADEDGVGKLTELKALCEELDSTLPQPPPPYPTDGPESDDDEDDVGGVSWEVNEQENGTSVAEGQAGRRKRPPLPRGTRANAKARRAPSIPPLADLSNQQAPTAGGLEDSTDDERIPNSRVARDMMRESHLESDGLSSDDELENLPLAQAAAQVLVPMPSTDQPPPAEKDIAVVPRQGSIEPVVLPNVQDKNETIPRRNGKVTRSMASSQAQSQGKPQRKKNKTRASPMFTLKTAVVTM